MHMVSWKLTEEISEHRARSKMWALPDVAKYYFFTQKPQQKNEHFWSFLPVSVFFSYSEKTLKQIREMAQIEV